VLKKLPRILIALALASSIGLHWAFLQVVAWTGMVISYSQDGTVTEAVVKTFDGKHPCCLCKQIDAGKKSERKTTVSITLKKLELISNSSLISVKAAADFNIVAASFGPPLQLSYQPPTPPPRGLLG
jgi:hypothetical protein